MMSLPPPAATFPPNKLKMSCASSRMSSPRGPFWGRLGRIDELHVLVNPKRAPKQIARDIESALRAHLDVVLDYKKISIAQVQGRAALGGAAAGAGACPPALFRCFSGGSRQPGRGGRASEAR